MQTFKKILLSFMFISLALTVSAYAKAQDNIDPTLEAEILVEEQVLAEDLEIKKPSLLPDSPFYFFKEWTRRIRLAFTSDEIKKAELENQFSNEILVELQALADKGVDQSIIERVTEKYQSAMDRVQQRANAIKQKASENEKVNSFLQKFTNQQMLHDRILKRIQNQVPEGAMQKIERAREQHIERFGQVMQKLEDRPEQVQEKIQNAIQNGKVNSGDMINKIQRVMPKNMQQQMQQIKNRIKQNPNSDPVVCTMDAKQCPDGSFVGRIAPSCEFAPCPNENSNQADCQNLWWFDQNTRACGQKSFCGTYMYQSLETFKDRDSCLRTLKERFNISIQNQLQNSANIGTGAGQNNSGN